jgi:hypothetical protein
MTERELVERARSLRPKLVEKQAAAEALTHYDEEMHEEFRRAGFSACSCRAVTAGLRSRCRRS